MRQWCLLALAGLLPALGWADVRTAQHQIEAQDLEGASETLQSQLKAHPQDDEARFLLARVLAWLGRSDEALGHYQELLTHEPDNADYLLGQGQALMWQGRPQAALVPLERAADIAPAYAEVQQALAQARSAATVPVTVPVAPVAAQAPTPRRRHELELSLRHDWVDSGLEDWRTQRLDYASSQPGALSWYGALTREQRFGDWDQGGALGAIIPLNENWSVQPEAGLQPSADFLPKWYADIRLQRRLPQGFIAAASLRRTQYETSQIDRLALAAERYWGAWRAGYTLNFSAVEGGGTPVGHALSLDYYYAGLSYLGVRTSFGEEEGLEERRIITSNVRSYSLQGRHWVDPRWAFSWEVGHLQQGSYYDRDWLMLGLRHAF